MHTSELSALDRTLSLDLLHFDMQCKKAIEVGRTHRAGFADIGKAYVRMSKAAVKSGDKEQGIKYLEDAQVGEGGGQEVLQERQARMLNDSRLPQRVTESCSHYFFARSKSKSARSVRN